MNRQRNICWLTSISVLVVGAMLSVACGGGGGNTVTPPGLSASWTPANANPGAMTISMGAGSASGTNFTFPVQVTGVDDFFGAAFRVNFDPATASFSGFSAAGSVIDDGGAVVLISATLGNAGEVLVFATRQQGSGGAYVPGVDINTTSTLITLNFRALSATSANNFTFSNREVQTCNDGLQTCDPIPDGNLTWSGGTMRAN